MARRSAWSLTPPQEWSELVGSGNVGLELLHARLVACELMQYRQPRTHSWRLDVCDSEGRQCLDMLFASVDDSIHHLTPELRRSVEDLCAKSSSLNEMIRALRLTIIEVRGTIARSEGAPYIAAINGVAVDNKTAHMGSAA